MAGKRQPRAATTTFVLDCSMAVAWFFEDEASSYAQVVEDSLATSSAVVPAHWPFEVANALLMGERRKRTTEAKATTFLGLLQSLPIKVDEETILHAWQEALGLARAHRLSAYDAVYLELALRRGFPIATLDEALKNAARACGVPEYNP